MTSRSFLLSTALAVAAWVGAVPAHATAITATTDIDISWAAPSQGGILPKAIVEMANFVFSGNTVTFQMRATNTSTGTSAGTDSRLTAIGWDTAPATTAVTDTTNVYASAVNVSLPSDNVSVCF
ncbi:MAG TPA: hypothetical protein VGI78_04550, partial [Acetobacteraceae bacterium]